MPPRNPSKPPPSDRAQRIAAGAVWGLTAFLGVTALAIFFDVSLLWWALISLVTVVITVWGMDRKGRREKQQGV